MYLVKCATVSTSGKILESERRVVCLIDGDETMFALSQITKGTAGGRFVAATLTESIQEYISSTQYPLRAWVFFSKCGLLDMIKTRTYASDDACKGIEDFVQGFSQASDRFLMIDIGSGKGAIASKVKGYLSRP